MDLDLHGILRIRLLDATPHDGRAVARQLGAVEVAPAGPPDLTVRFVERLALTLPIRHVILGQSGFTPDGYVVSAERGRPRWALIPFDQLDQGGEIVCERGARHIPLLQPVVNLIALSKGVLPLHASACMEGAVGLLFSAFPQGGKTSALLAFTARGARFVSDDWVYLRDGQVLGIPSTITLRDWQLASLPEYSSALSRSERRRMSTLRRLHRAGSLLHDRLPSDGAAGRVVARLARSAESGVRVEIDARRLFPAAREALCGRLDRLFLIMVHESDDVEVSALDPALAAARLIALQQDERRDLMRHYALFRFAFPERGSALVEQAAEIEHDLIGHSLSTIQSYAVFHPHPVILDRLYRAVRPYTHATN